MFLKTVLHEDIYVRPATTLIIPGNIYTVSEIV